MSTQSIGFALLLVPALVSATALQAPSPKQPAKSVTSQIRVPAPSFIGKTYDQAVAYNNTAYIVDGRRTRFFAGFNSVNQTNGTVIYQRPLPNTLVAPGGVVTLTFKPAPDIAENHPDNKNEVKVPPTIESTAQMQSKR